MQAFNIILPKDLVLWADRMAQVEYKNRSELIREALMSYLLKKQAWAKIFEIGERAGKKMGIKSEEDADRMFFEFRHGKKNKQS